MAEHYFSENPTSAQARQPVDVSVWGHQLRLDSASGVFAAGRLDKGTAVLFSRAAPPSEPGTFLDLGCGYGVIACALAVALPGAQVWAVDVNERALLLCGDNARSLGLGERVHPVRADEVPTGIVFDEIWSNPPIHIGKAALHDLLTTWLARLAPEGRAVLVVARNLGADSLQRWIDDSGFTCRRLGSAKGFRVFEVRRRPA
ncbi:MAG: rRNA (guanine1207-N2)-methyltransferase [Nocardioidaceae bacterium]|jgi:16S rRNA G1207 methylase RsmC|nr:rRNA (guanine1207-N2)-methyltransferase [Nocardioidaceae bacterium]MDX6307807.1 rRNA (guanine1207-N2)-methyltransferase [Nocardioidaceae bacterium]